LFDGHGECQLVVIALAVSALLPLQFPFQFSLVLQFQSCCDKEDDRVEWMHHRVIAGITAKDGISTSSYCNKTVRG
jgi:hypothetical protein